ncbi:TRIO and F-actin binding protein b isoform X2 [Oncorhynchus tshawytscha]|uniref:TRIO and F-actin binding protein b isoform X2 n=1 Tax=Oncorhynchus tshawytscha TaxID=74940 RepID=UPI001C3C7C21|nr:TRIO and F-actin binding protein b isoform X2 [Oncorhynchus tshawytscha]
MQRHTSSQSSMESSESGQLSGESTERNREEYAMMADLPKVKPVLQRERLRHVGQTPNLPSGRQELFKPASHSLSKHPSREWLDDSGDLERNHIEWHNGSSGRLSRAHSSTSLQTQRPHSPTIEEEASPWRAQHSSSLEQMQPDLLNFKKGWMSKLDENGEWKKHWFVLTDAGLRYYRDSGAEEKDDLDGEVDLKSCVKVSEFDVEKNYGFQIQTREAVVTLSAMTAGIRRNWIEVLRKSVRPSSSPDLTQLPEGSSDKENSRSLASTHRPPSRHGDAGSEITTSSVRRFDCVELSPVPVPSSPLPATQREAGEGQGREHAQWQEERSRDVTSSTWEQVLSRKGPGVGSDPRIRAEEEIEKKWAEFERLPLKEMRSLLPMGSRSSHPANEALQREVASLRQQLERLQGGGCGGGGGGGVGGGSCGREATCGRSLQAMERAHKQVLEELQKQHARETRELERDRDRVLREETQDTAQVMETLKKAHKEELEREVEKAKRLGGGSANTQTLRTQQQLETQALQRELSGLSERYSQKCLELNRAEQSNGEREKDITRKESELEQLRKENQDLQARLTEEISRMRSIVTGQGSEGVSHNNQDRPSCELEVLLRVKENEVQYLHKEISCLRNELQFLNTEKQSACERYQEVHGELSGMKRRSEREIQSLREHLRLAMVALQEGQKLGNSLEH